VSPILRSRAVPRRLAALLLVLLAPTGCASGGGIPGEGTGPAATEAADPGDPLLYATAWMQTAAEYEASTLQTYRAAGRALERALRNGGRSALVSDRRPPEGTAERPPAVVLDVDETVLDNSLYQARLVREGRSYEPESWAAWVREAAARPVPGALEFAHEAARRGVSLFYVTNRDHELEEPTRRNLERLGFPLDGERDVLLTEGERPEWGSDKTARRAEIARTHRILLLVGDNLGDFVAVPDTTPEARRRIAREHAGRWGREWIVLPNPAYGDWQQALQGHESGLPRAEVHRRMRDALRTTSDTTG